MNVAEDHYKLLTEEENKELFGMLKDIKSVLESLSESIEKTLPDTNESAQAQNDLPERMGQQVEDFLKSIDGKISELNRAAENFSGTVKDTGELQQRLEQFTTQKDSLQEMLDTFAANVRTCKETTERQNTVELEQLKTDKQRLEGELQTKTADFADKQRELESIRGELQTKTAELDGKQRELESIRGELQTKTAELDGKQRELESIRGELQTKTAELDGKQRELEGIRGEVKEIEAQAAQAKESLQSVKNIFSAYEPVLAALKNCPLFSEYVNEHDLAAGDSKALFRLARTMGETSDFASEIHSIAVEAKKNSKEPLTAAEGTVYKAISRCYAEIWNIDFDIFICPGEQSTDKPYKTTNFNRSDMINLLDPRDKVSKYAQEVYVPLLRTKNRGLISQARVKAGNDMK